MNSPGSTARIAARSLHAARVPIAIAPMAARARPGPIALALGLTVLAALAPAPTRACALCDCGDPTLTTTGIEKPYKNRVRLALDERFAGHSEQLAGIQTTMWSLRSTLVATWSPIDRLTIGAVMPLVAEWVTSSGAPSRTITGVGDAELFLRGVVWRDRRFSPRHLVSLLGGMKFPTAPRLRDDLGYPYDEDEQPGSGSFDPYAGASWGWFGTRLSTFVSASYRLTTDGRRDYRRGMSLGGTAGVQFQPMARVSLGLAADVGWAAADSQPDSNNAGRRMDVPDTGGAILALTPSIMVSPVERWLIRLAVQVHVGEWLSGSQAESHALLLSTVVDLN